MTSYLPDIFRRNAEKSPSHDFLVEDRQVALSYAQAYSLAVGLLPNRLLRLHPQLAESANANVVVILSPNNALIPLALFALWALGAKVVPLSTVADPSLWAGMINLVCPELILVAPNLRNSLTHSLKEYSLHTKYSAIIDISTLVPEEYLSPFLKSAPDRVSNYIPACKRWLDHELQSFTSAPTLKFSTSFSIESDTPAITLFTSSAVDWSSLKCVTYTHTMLAHSGRRAMLMLGGSSYESKPKRHLGWLPLSHCFEFCITLW
jgi:acyl-CoA synthetase (AMP-forming)/AMP-acid ligase II